jgi:hypothetical protein
MSTAVYARLNPEPPQPQELADQHLPPKSYAEVAGEGTKNDAGGVPYEANGNVSPNDVNGSAHPNNVNGSAKVNGMRRNIDDDRVLYDEHISQKGEKLTSIKPDEGYEDRLKHVAETAPRQKGRSGKKQDGDDAQLASGRRAGAGWERSA